ncbi:NnrS family protein [Paremcibacter congregatus]|uniref:NnrS family protein n=1 Tax=Paremcibacter congregatus TaxID=2043170 RepID=UPI0030ED4166|tara:strand:+ start:1268 stop:2440 length:1173 start_codon:yes stop_codon:yes gene_type:complete
MRPDPSLFSTLFSAGFRVFFPLAALSSAVLLGYWVLLVTGGVETLPSRFDPVSWHQHEMIFGMVSAVIIGFLYTAVPNWTGRPTPTGAALAGLGLIWILGRVSIFYGAHLPIWLPLLIDGLFLPLAVIGVVKALIGAANKRNYFLPVVLLLFAGLNIVSHLAATGLIAFEPRRLFLPAVLFIVFLMNVIGGRIIPNFTKGKYPALTTNTPAVLLPLSVIAIFGLAAALLLQASDMVIGGIALFAGGVTLIRSLSWKGWAVAHDPILFILHLGYFWIPVGFFLVAYSSLTGEAPLSHALHAFTVGAVGSLTLGVMSRATLGHSGLPLNNEVILTVIFVSITIAALSRAVLPLLLPESYLGILQGAGGLWILAYGLFLLRFGKIFITPRKLF